MPCKTRLWVNMSPLMQYTWGRLQGMFQRCAHSLEFLLKKGSTMLTRLCQKCRNMYAPIAADKHAAHCCDTAATRDITMDVRMQHVHMRRSWWTS